MAREINLHQIKNDMCRKKGIIAAANNGKKLKGGQKQSEEFVPENLK